MPYSEDRTKILMMTMKALSVKIPRLELFEVQNIGEFVDVFYEKTQSA